MTAAPAKDYVAHHRLAEQFVGGPRDLVDASFVLVSPDVQGGGVFRSSESAP
jgi:hypothetical protein